MPKSKENLMKLTRSMLNLMVYSVDRVPLTFKSLVIILPVEEIESVGVKIWLSREEGIFAPETKAVQETDVESWQGHEREVNREFYFRQFSRLIGYRSLEQALVIILPA